MTQQETDEKTPPIRYRFRKWAGELAGITKGWLLLSIVLGWVFLACAVYAAVRTVQLDTRVTDERIQSSIDQQIVACVEGNVTRAEARSVALADVIEDRRIWVSIDALVIGGLPGPLDTLVFDSLQLREDRIKETYVDRDCTTITLEG